MNDESVKNGVIVMGGGLTGLSAGYVISKAGGKVLVIEADSSVGGLSKTIEADGFRFDLGGHRFYTKDDKIDGFIRELMGEELLTVARKSKILLRDRFFDYPLKPLNSVFGLGPATTIRIMADYGIERLRSIWKKPADVSLEDWVVRNFGRAMFNIYFKQYSEKVWGIDCSRISRDWVSKRISGLSLGKAIKNAFFGFSGRELPTLADSFVYPRLGIGRISDRLREDIEEANPVRTSTLVTKINHSDSEIKTIEARNCNSAYSLDCDRVVSTIPVTNLVNALNPSAPEDVVEAAKSLGYRDLVIVALMINRPRVTDQTWIYIPEQSIPFGRIHEPTNWSPYMAPEGKTLLVIEYFCFKGDGIWNATDDELISLTSEHLEKLGFIKKEDAIGGAAVRVPRAYPLFEIGYERHVQKIMDYLGGFKNLHIAGRGGMFRYYNMDHAIESGMKAAEEVLHRAQK